jgi:gamma-glutamylcyclotransferase (GGCT)/AIG2-like uncharacterized protein YtfP
VNCSLFFIYGTLRRGFEGHPLLQRLGARYASKGTVNGQLFDLGSFPGAVKPAAAPRAGRLNSQPSEPATQVPASRHPGRGQPRVTGEVFRFSNPERAVNALDAYEGFRPASPQEGLYARELTEVTLEAGGRITAWIYWLNRPPKGMRRIGSGDYSKKG